MTGRTIVGAAFVTMLLAGGASAQPLFTAVQDPAAGARVFNDKGCVTCHAINGAGGTIGPDLAQVSRPRTFFDLAAGLWNHAPRMTARMRELGITRPSLTPQESADLAGYLYTLSYFDRPGNPEAGQRVFEGKQCVTCHQVGGAGGSVGPRLDAFRNRTSPIALAAAMWNHGPAMTAAMEAKGIARPTFKGSELSDLIAYVERASSAAPAGPLYALPGRASEGLRLLIDKRCLECHSAGVKGENNLADRAVHKSLTQFAAGMWNKLPRMTAEMKARGIAFRTLKPEEMADIVAFLYATRYFAQAGDPRGGVILATYKGCLGCHGLYGEAGKTAGDLARSPATATAPGALAALWNHALAEPAPVFTGRDMADLMAYLRSLKPPIVAGGERRGR